MRGLRAMLMALALAAPLSLAPMVPIPTASAEDGCPYGAMPVTTPTGIVCTPGSRYPPQQQQQQAPEPYREPPPPRAMGNLAYATDTGTEYLFWAIEYGSSTAAVRSAMTLCAKETGKTCRPLLVATEQCIAVAVGGGGVPFPATNRSWSGAAADAIRQCKGKSVGGRCNLWQMPVCAGARYSRQDSGDAANNATPEDVKAMSEKLNPHLWGAVSIDSQDRPGVVTRRRSKERAEADALAGCRKVSAAKDGCRIILTTDRGFVSIALGKDGWPYAYGHDQAAVADREALKFCQDKTTGCRVSQTQENL